MTETIIGDALTALRSQPDNTFQMCVTSPPYWGGQRDYGMPGQIGMERTPEEYVSVLVSVFEQVRRVLRTDGVLWINIGDAYAAGGKGGGGRLMARRGKTWEPRLSLKGWRSPPPGYKAKDLVLCSALLAIALQRQGWYLRRDLIWVKPRATEPTRVDRPSAQHEHILLLSKAKKYFYDGVSLPQGDVWTINPRGTVGKHCATFPDELARRCILAGSREGDVVIDPFGGSGTTGKVAASLGRHSLLIELNPEYTETVLIGA